MGTRTILPSSSAILADRVDLVPLAEGQADDDLVDDRLVEDRLDGSERAEEAPAARQVVRLVVEEAGHLEAELAMVLELGSERLAARPGAGDEDEADVLAGTPQAAEGQAQDDPIEERGRRQRREEAQQE